MQNILDEIKEVCSSDKKKDLQKLKDLVKLVPDKNLINNHTWIWSSITECGCYKSARILIKAGCDVFGGRHAPFLGVAGSGWYNLKILKYMWKTRFKYISNKQTKSKKRKDTIQYILNLSLSGAAQCDKKATVKYLLSIGADITYKDYKIVKDCLIGDDYFEVPSYKGVKILVKLKIPFYDKYIQLVDFKEDYSLKIIIYLLKKNKIKIKLRSEIQKYKLFCYYLD